MQNIYEAIIKAHKNQENVALATIIECFGSTPRNAGAKMLIYANGKAIGTIGGSTLEYKVIIEAKAVLRKGKPSLISLELTDENNDGEMICGGKCNIFIEPLLAPAQLIIMGAGHCSLALYHIAILNGFSVMIIDNRPEWANKENFPLAEIYIISDYKKIFNQLSINEKDFIVIMTAGHKFDKICLQQSIETSARYIGMMGSKAKSLRIFSQLREDGINEEQLKRIHTPIGLEIKAETPEEIAISIMAEIIAEYR